MNNRIHRLGLIAPISVAKRMRGKEKTTLECKRIMAGIYCPAVINFMLTLATRRDRLQQLRDLVSMGWKADDIRRMIMNETYISANILANLTSQDAVKFIWEIPYIHRGRFGNIWQRIRFAIGYWRRRRQTW